MQLLQEEGAHSLSISIAGSMGSPGSLMGW